MFSYYVESLGLLTKKFEFGKNCYADSEIKTLVNKIHKLVNADKYPFNWGMPVDKIYSCDCVFSYQSEKKESDKLTTPSSTLNTTLNENDNSVSETLTKDCINSFYTELDKKDEKTQLITPVLGVSVETLKNKETVENEETIKQYLDNYKNSSSDSERTQWLDRIESIMKSLKLNSIKIDDITLVLDQQAEKSKSLEDLKESKNSDNSLELSPKDLSDLSSSENLSEWEVNDIALKKHIEDRRKEMTLCKAQEVKETKQPKKEIDKEIVNFSVTTPLSKYDKHTQEEIAQTIFMESVKYIKKTRPDLEPSSDEFNTEVFKEADIRLANI